MTTPFSSTTPPSHGRPPLSPSHAHDSNNLKNSQSLRSKATPSPLVVDEMDQGGAFSPQHTSMGESNDDDDDDEDDTNSFNIDSFFVTKRSTAQGKASSNQRSRRQSMSFDLSSSQSSGSSTEQACEHIDTVEVEENAVDSTVAKPSTTLTVMDRVNGAVGRLLQMQYNTNTQVQTYQRHLKETNAKLKARDTEHHRTQALFDTLKQDVVSLMNEKISLQNELNMLKQQVVVPAKELGSNDLEERLKEALGQIKTLKFENEICLQEMNQQRLHFEEEVEELEVALEEAQAEEEEEEEEEEEGVEEEKEEEEEEEKEETEKKKEETVGTTEALSEKRCHDLASRNNVLEKEMKESKAQVAMVKEQYTMALKQALGRNKELSKQLEELQLAHK
jgi:hypothetical protein